jgi:prolyl-tRNA synthetase
VSNVLEEQGFVKEITKMSVDIDRWYTDVVRKAELADYSPVRGCMVIRPYGYGLWENIQRAFDDMIKSTDPPHENMYFPLLIPEELFMKEAEHIEGFAPEVAWVTEAGKGRGKLEQPLVIRPTSETIIGPIMRRYIQSHRDLPKLTNQWCNVLRWEMRTRLLLRTAEFLWQEGHTFHSNHEEAAEEVMTILGFYRDVAETWLAVPVLMGRKSEAEKFAGGEYTTSIEGMMRDGLALQMGTSHHLGQNFSRAYDIAFTNRENRREHCYTTSWGISTRLLGAIVMAHGDDSGLVLPPRVATVQVVVVPIFRDSESRARVQEFIAPLVPQLKAAGIRHRVDWREDTRPGEKYAEWEMRGVPLRVEVGPRDVESGQVVVVDRLTREKRPTPANGLAGELEARLEAFHVALFERARRFREENTTQASSLEELVSKFTGSNPFVWASWCGAAACETHVKEATGASIRVIPFETGAELPPRCVVCGQPAPTPVVFARAY